MLNVSANLFATEPSSLATNAVVITPFAASGAIVGPVKTAKGYVDHFPLISPQLQKISTVFRARPFAKSSNTDLALRCGIKSFTTSKITDEGTARTIISTPSEPLQDALLRLIL